jgi:hypothetical protein
MSVWLTLSKTRLYKVSFDRPVMVEGMPYGGTTPFQAAYLVTGEGPAFKRVIPGSSWDDLDIRLYDKLFDDSKSLPIKVTIAIPKGWDTALILAVITQYVRDNDTLRIHRDSGCIRDIFEWFLQDPQSVARYFTARNNNVYQCIQASEDTHLS